MAAGNAGDKGHHAHGQGYRSAATGFANSCHAKHLWQLAADFQSLETGHLAPRCHTSGQAVFRRRTGADQPALADGGSQNGRGRAGG